METTEKIVESYCRYVKQWFTIPNIKCKGQYEVDLLAVDTTSRRIKRYHVECGVSISGNFSKLTAKNFSTDDLKIRVKQAGQRRTMGYFIHRKFELPEVRAELSKYGFENGNYSKVIVTWGWTPEAKEIADKAKIEIWDFRDLLQKIASASKEHKTYLRMTRQGRFSSLRNRSAVCTSCRYKFKGDSCAAPQCGKGFALPDQIAPTQTARAKPRAVCSWTGSVRQASPQ